MKKLIGLVFGVLAMHTAYAACTVQEASNKAMAISYQSQAIVDQNKNDATKLTSYTTKMNEAGTALSKGDYDTACKLYDEVAKEFNVSTTAKK